MTEHTEQTASQAGAVPARIELEDFIAAVTRGVARALAVEEDEVSGYALLGGSTTGVLGTLGGRPPILVGIFPPPSGDQTISRS